MPECLNSPQLLASSVLIFFPLEMIWRELNRLFPHIFIQRSTIYNGKRQRKVLGLAIMKWNPPSQIDVNSECYRFRGIERFKIHSHVSEILWLNVKNKEQHLDVRRTKQIE